MRKACREVEETCSCVFGAVAQAPFPALSSVADYPSHLFPQLRNMRRYTFALRLLLPMDIGIAIFYVITAFERRPMSLYLGTINLQIG